MILIISNKWDIAVDFVVRELKKRSIDFYRLNTEDLINKKVVFDTDSFDLNLCDSARSVGFKSCLQAVWLRRPGKPFSFLEVQEKPSVAVQNFIIDQWHAWLDGLELFEGVKWVNPRWESQLMESKLRQLRLASEVGFFIPRTIVSNCGSSIRNFCIEEGGSIVAKALHAPLIEGDKEDLFVFTNVVSMGDLSDDQALALSPTIFQQKIFPKIDYRVTVVGDSVMTAKITPSDTLQNKSIDWRTFEKDALLSVARLPDDVEDMCRRYVRLAGLVFGAIDLVFHENKYYFLEINPSGEWGWLEKRLGLPISMAIVDVLSSRG